MMLAVTLMATIGVKMRAPCDDLIGKQGLSEGVEALSLKCLVGRALISARTLTQAGGETTSTTELDSTRVRVATLIAARLCSFRSLHPLHHYTTSRRPQQWRRSRLRRGRLAMPPSALLECRET